MDVNDVSNHHIQIWWPMSKFISRYGHFYCCFIKWSVNFLLIQCFVIKGLYLYPYLFPEDGILKFIKYHLSLKTGANPIYCSFFLSKWWTFELKRCKCSHLAQKVADIYEHVLYYFWSFQQNLMIFSRETGQSFRPFWGPNLGQDIFLWKSGFVTLNHL